MIRTKVYFPISTNIYFPISLKTNPLSSLMYPLFCFFVISQVKKTTTKIQGALDEDQESQVNTFSTYHSFSDTVLRKGKNSKLFLNF